MANVLRCIFATSLACANGLYLRAPPPASSEDSSYSLEEFMQEHNLTFSGGLVEVKRSVHAESAAHLHVHAWALADAIGSIVTEQKDSSFAFTKNSESVAMHIRPSNYSISSILVTSESIWSALQTGALNIHSGTVTVGFDDREPLTRREVDFGGWNGRMGNNLLQIGAALIFARHLNATKLTFKYPYMFKQAAPILFWLPNEMTLERPTKKHLLQNCKNPEGRLMAHEQINFWYTKCKLAPAEMYHHELRAHVLPYMTPRLKQCVDAPEQPEEHNQLTVHLRVGDVVDKAFPCSGFSKIYKEGAFTRLQVIKSLDPEHPHPCQTVFKNEVARPHFRNDTLLGDFCTLLRARNIFVSSSTFPEAAVLLSDRVQRVYHGAFEWEPHFDFKGVSWCNNDAHHLWPGGPVVTQYEMPGYQQAMVLKYPATMIQKHGVNNC